MGYTCAEVCGRGNVFAIMDGRFGQRVYIRPLSNSWSRAPFGAFPRKRGSNFLCSVLGDGVVSSKPGWLVAQLAFSRTNSRGPKAGGRNSPGRRSPRLAIPIGVDGGGLWCELVGEV